MHLSPYDPPGLFIFGSIALLFLLALIFLPRRVSVATTVYGITSLSILPTVISFVWVYWFFHSLAVSGYAGPRDPADLAREILNTSLFGIIMSSLMLVLSGIYTFWVQKRPSPRLFSRS